MEQIYITNLRIENVRHLHDITIPLASDKRKHLILTGKNGSGKTSLIEALANNLNHVFADRHFSELEKQPSKVKIAFNIQDNNLWELQDKYPFVLAYYEAGRVFSAVQPKHVEKIKLKDKYGISEFPREEFVKYLLDLKMTEALARNNNNVKKADKIHRWFEKFEALLKQIFDDQTISLIFDEETFEFHISQEGKELFDFNTLSSGYQAVLDIVLDVIMRMEKQTQRSFDFNLAGIVLIDEIETHLHLELQKNIMPLLTAIFPNIQFIVTSHSPFILNSIENAVIYDLENRVLVKNGLQNIPYDGIVEGYFGAKILSNVLEEKFARYKELAVRESWSDEEIYEIQELELYLDEIPDYLALEIATEYQKLKLQVMERMDMDG